MSLVSAILSTVAFFDIFDHPLTAFEIREYLPVAANLEEVMTALERSPLARAEGYFFLPGRENLPAVRRQRYIATDIKIKKARRRLRIFSWLPWIRLIALANVIGTHNLRPGGDTDLFIITRPGRLWLTKVCATIILKLSNLRPTPSHSADRLCLSFLVDEQSLNLSTFRLDNDDHYFAYWFASLVPLYGDPATYHKLIQNNTWLSEVLPNFPRERALPRLRFRHSNHKDWLAFLGGMGERFARRIQSLFMAPAIRELANKDRRVVVTDHVLKLHTVDRRDYFKTEHAKRLQAFPNL